jgi:hypothetical protein
MYDASLSSVNEKNMLSIGLSWEFHPMMNVKECAALESLPVITYYTVSCKLSLERDSTSQHIKRIS